MRHYHSKLLLFGEYLIIRSGRALAIPFEKFRGQWSFAPEDTSLQQDLKGLLEYLMVLCETEAHSCVLDIQKLEIDLNKGMYFESNIPMGYGLGSSGALSAAIYDNYILSGKISRGEEAKFIELRNMLSKIESYFHGSSSGVDPLISYLDKGSIIRKDGSVKILGELENTFNFFLLDTGIHRETAPLVNLFFKKCNDPFFANQIDGHLTRASNAAIDSFVGNDEAGLAKNMFKISSLQYQLFKEMIPDGFKEIWKRGLGSGKFNLKLCGAGGGGFLLGYAADLKECEKELEGFKWQVI